MGMLNKRQRTALTKWAEALESGSYHQIGGYLFGVDEELDHPITGHCCVGVAGCLAGMSNRRLKGKGLLAHLAKPPKGPLVDFLLTFHQLSNFGGEDVNFGFGDNRLTAEEFFTQLNDDELLSFDDIALQIYLLLELDLTDDLNLVFEPEA